jgi:hypothetical protein
MRGPLCSFRCNRDTIDLVRRRDTFNVGLRDGQQLMQRDTRCLNALPVYVVSHDYGHIYSYVIREVKDQGICPTQVWCLVKRRLQHGDRELVSMSYCLGLVIPRLHQDQIVEDSSLQLLDLTKSEIADANGQMVLHLAQTGKYRQFMITI